jgi:WD40 repeat protein
MDQIYICKYNNCKKYYETPVILPCRTITCKQHIDKFFIKKDGRDKFECEFCDEIHVIPKNGFNINHSLMNAMERNLHLTGKYRLVMQRLKELESLIADIDLSNLLNDPECFIYDYFQDLRNKIDLQRETLIMEIHKFSDKMISQLELSEKEYKMNYEQKFKFNFKNRKLEIEDLNNFDLKNLKQNLRIPNVSDDLIDMNLKKIDENIEKINLTKNKAKHDLLKGKLIDFQPSLIDIKIFGKFFFTNICKFSTDSDPKYLVNFEGHSRSIRKIVLMENLNILISASNDQTIKIWNLSNGHCLKTIEAHKRFITGLCLIQDYKFITSSSDFWVKIWNLNDYKCIESFEFSQIVHSICKLSDELIIFGFKTGNIIIWDIIKKEEVGNILHAHDSRVACMKLYDSNRLISGSKDRKIKIWDLSNKKLLNVLNGHDDEIICLEIINNHKLASGSADRTIKIWDLLTSKLIDTIYMTNAVISIKDRSEYLIIGLADAIAIYHLKNKCFLKTYGELPAFLNGIELLSNGNIVCYTLYPNFSIKIIKNDMYGF